MSPSKEPKEPKEPKADAKGSGKPRVYALAAELNLDTKAVLEFCKELGFASIKNQLSAVELEQAEAIRDRAKRGPKTPAVPPPPPAKPSTPAKLDTKIPTLNKPKPAPLPSTPKVTASTAVKPSPTQAPSPAQPLSKPEPIQPVAASIVAETVAPATHEQAAEASVAADPHPAKSTPPAEPTAAAVLDAKPTLKPVIQAQPEPISEPALPSSSPVQLPQETVPSTVEAVGSETPRSEPSPGVPPTVPQLPPKMPNLSNRPPVLSSNRPMNLPSGNRPQTLPPKPPNVPTNPQPRPQGTAPTTSGSASSQPGAGPNRPSPTPPVGGPGPHRSGGASPSGGPGSQPGTGGPNRPAPRVPQPNPGGVPTNRYGPGGSGPPRSPGSAPPRPPMPGQGQGPAGPGGPKPNTTANKQLKLTPEQIQKMRQTEQQRGVRLTMDQIQKQIAAPPTDRGRPDEPPPATGPSRTGDRARPHQPRPDDTSDEGDRRGGGTTGDKRRPGGVVGREDRQAKRQDKGRQRGPTTDKAAVIIGAGGRVDMIEEQRGSRMKRRPGKGLDKGVSKSLSGKIEISLPITVRSLSEAIGMKAGEVLLKLKNLTNSLYTINSTIDFPVAEMIAIEKTIELVAKKQETVEDKAIRALEERALKSDAANMVLRPPIVTIMGHVDHGKTSLLDKIRQTYGLSSDVVSTEAGGITQVLRAWRVEKDGKSTTFLDTPGHEAFTKMRARGANVTDIAVIVVSAADGVMPQTEEAVAHAKAAEVDIIVAINKVDLPDANIEKTRRQLYNLGLLPDNMGGEVPFVECSAKTGKGIDELLDNIATLAEFAELKADPTIPGSGTCLEGYLEGEKGVVATLLIQNGSLRKGDVVLCGSTYGRVRAMYNDMGRLIEEAGPSTPVKIIGLDEVPDADDPFFVVDDVTTAREIADKRRESKLEASLNKFSPVSLDKLKEATAKTKITELKVILKAEARGSVEAIKKELEKLVHEEVRVRVLHSGIGAITESDVTLALTSPADTMIVGFNVTADDAALKLAEERDISIREYQIIYNLVDDVKAALEGRLKPTEEVIHLGRAVVRETFKISKVGTVAGCFVTSGVLERSARVRVIREGTVVYPSADKSVGLDNLKRFKDDVREVREGFECGLKISGFDDIKVGDVIEAFKIEIRYRKL